MQWASYTSKHQSLKLHLCFELNRMLAVEFLVTAANFSERAALIKMLKAGVTYIADRGYMSFKVGDEVLKAKAHFVFRVKTGLRLTVTKTLLVQLPKTVAAIFNNVTDELIRYTNDEFKHIYRLVCFSIGFDQFHILTDRHDLTTFQVIMLYALRWQIELLFRFLKRTINGIHLIKQDERGVTIQFYTMLIAALLELRLKQMTADMDGSDDAQSSEKISQELAEGVNGFDQIPATDTQKEGRGVAGNWDRTPKTAKLLSYEYQFIENIGKKLYKYWKIGIHWLTALKSLLAEPFDERAVKILNSS
ncbi:transposase of IS641 [Beggiatoa sp. PS]|nr:transposase of IS641 [Beggiatoa sp. PS]